MVFLFSYYFQVYHREYTGGSDVRVAVHMYDTDLYSTDENSYIRNEKQTIRIQSEIIPETQVS